LSPRWQDQLTERLEAKAHVALYNDPDPSPVSASCNECSVLLFSDVTGDQAKQRGVMGDGS
jgi:hypothetical protein